MPNWCINNVIVHGPLPDRERLLHTAGVGTGDDLTLVDKVRPQPAEVTAAQDMPSTDGHIMPDWYQWRLENWGSKWTESQLEVIESNESFTHLKFDSAWSPMIPGYVAISAAYPTLTFVYDYIEPGMNFCGAMRISAGVIEADEFCGDLVEDEDDDDSFSKLLDILDTLIERVDIHPTTTTIQ